MTEVNVQQTNDEVTPVVIERRRKKKGRQYSRGLRDVQILERNVTRAARRVTGSIDDGIAAYSDARDRSSRKRRDGAIVDFIPNAAEGVSETIRTLSPLPNDLARVLYPRRARRIMRRQVRSVTRLVDDVIG